MWTRGVQKPEIRSILAVTFVVETMFGWPPVLFTLQLLSGMLLGLFSTRWMASFLDRRWLCPAVLLFATVSGLAAMPQVLVG